jgi:Carboxypeptidase regulatory-like domain/TonB-dependent Receptor Plug Domain
MLEKKGNSAREVITMKCATGLGVRVRIAGRMAGLMAMVAVFYGAFPLACQAQLATATINGTVRDSSGAVIPGATVTLTNESTNAKRVVDTNTVGFYVVPGIIPGAYELEVAKRGFVTARQGPVTLFVNQTATLDFKLSVGSTRQTVSVVASAARLEASTAEIGTVINTADVNDLPLNGRNFTELLTLTPGVSPVSVAQNNTGGGQWAGNAIGTFTFPSVNGQTNRSNLFYLDGINDEGSFISSYATPPIVDQIQEFKVQSHNDLAEYGQTLGGIVNVATKSGTNQFHGDAWEFLRNNAFDARNPFLATVPPFKQNQFGGTLGGPVILPGYNGKTKRSSSWRMKASGTIPPHRLSTGFRRRLTLRVISATFQRRFIIPSQHGRIQRFRASIFAILL